MACERCWSDAYRESHFTGGHQAEIYRRLLRERADDPCPPDLESGREDRR